MIGRLTKTRRHTQTPNDANEPNAFLWQTRSFKGYSFLNGVASCATNGYIILIGNQGAAREGTKTHLQCFVRLRCLPFAVYSRCAPVSLVKHDGSPSCDGAVDGGDSAAFSGFFYTRTESCFWSFIYARPTATNANRWAVPCKIR